MKLAKFTLSIITVILLCVIYNFVFIPDLFARENYISKILFFPIFSLNSEYSKLINILMLIGLLLLIFIQGKRLKKYFFKFLSSFAYFFPLVHHIFIIAAISLIISSLIFNYKYYQEAFFFRGDYVVIILSGILLSILIPYRNEVENEEQEETNEEMPIRKMKQDIVGFSAQIDEITETIITRKNANASLSIGLFAPWGYGKSSFMNLLIDNITSRKCDYLFDEYRNSRIGKKFCKELNNKKEVDYGSRETMLNDVGGKIFLDFFQIRKIFNGVRNESPESKNRDEFVDYDRAMFISLNAHKYENLDKIYIYFFHEIIKALQRETILPRLDSISLIKTFIESIIKGVNVDRLVNNLLPITRIDEYLQKVSGWLVKMNKIVVCLVDDVDRLSKKEEIESVLKLVNLVKMNMKNVIIIVSVDQNIFKLFL